jgi:hypothetical protein
MLLFQGRYGTKLRCQWPSARQLFKTAAPSHLPKPALRCAWCDALDVTPRRLRRHVEASHPEELRAGTRRAALTLENVNGAGAFGYVPEALVDYHFSGQPAAAREAAVDLLADVGRLVGRWDKAPPTSLPLIRALLKERQR